MFILDSDHATLYQQGHPFLGQHLTHLPPHFLATTVVTYEEQIEGRLAIVRRARTKQERVNAIGDKLRFLLVCQGKYSMNLSSFNMNFSVPVLRSAST